MKLIQSIRLPLVLGVLAAIGAGAIWQRHQLLAVSTELEWTRTLIQDTQDLLSTSQQQSKVSQTKLDKLLQKSKGVRDEESAPPDVGTDKTSLLGEANWQPDLPYVDVSKRLIASLKIPALKNDDIIGKLPDGRTSYDFGGGPDEISPEAAAFFGLSPAEREAIMGLHQEMQNRFLHMEQQHFHRPSQSDNTFVLPAFPQDMETLRAEWSARLGELLGPQRGNLLVVTFSNPTGTGTSSPASRAGGAFGEMMDQMVRKNVSRPNWLRDGTNEFLISVTLGGTYRTIDRGDVPAQSFTVKSARQVLGVTGGRRVPVGEIPERWQHLITQEMLNPQN